MTSSPQTQRQPGWRVMLVPDLGDQLLTDLAAWEDEDAGDPFPARQALWLPAPLAGRGALGAVWRGGGFGVRVGASGLPHRPPSASGSIAFGSCAQPPASSAAERRGAGGGGY